MSTQPLSIVSSQPLPTGGLSVVSSQPLPTEQPQAQPTWWDKLKDMFRAATPDELSSMKEAAANLPPGTVSADWNPDTKSFDVNAPGQKVVQQVKARNYAGAAHTAISQVAAGSAPLAIPAAIGAPFAFLASLIGGAGGQYGGVKLAQSFGANPDQAALAGDVGAFAGGYAGFKAIGAGKVLAGNFGRLSPEQATAARPVGTLQPALDNTPEEVLNYASQKGIDLTPGEALQTPLSQTAQAIGERSLAQGGVMANAREVASAKFADSIQDFAKRSDPYGLGVTQEDAGRAIQQAVRVGQNISRENASQAYQDLPQDLMNAKVDVSDINRQYFQAMKEAETSLANRNPQIAAQIKSVYDQFSNLGTPAETATGTPYKKPEVDFQTLLKMRSDALQDGDSLARAGAPTEVQGMYRRIAGQLDDLAESTADKFGATGDWREANAGWKEYQTKYNDPQSPLYRALTQSDPAKTTQAILNRGSASDIEMMKSEHMDAAVEAVRRQVLTDIANRGFAVRGDGLAGYSDTFLRSLFGPNGSKELYINGDIARRMKFQMNPSGTSNVLLGLEQATSPRALIGTSLFARAAMPRPAASYLPSTSAAQGSPLQVISGVRALLNRQGNQ